MLDEQNFTRIVKKHKGLVVSRCARFGFKGEDLNDAISDVWAALWSDRMTWPAGGPQNEVAFLRTAADRTAQDKKRRGYTQKRGRETVSIDDDANNAGLSLAVSVAADQEDAIDLARLNSALRVVAQTLPPDLEDLVITDLNGEQRLNDKVKRQRAMRNARRALALDPDSPKNSRVEDPAGHVIKKAMELQLAAEKHVEDTCGEQLSFVTKETRTTSAAGRASRSPLPPSASERSRSERQARRGTPDRTKTTLERLWFTLEQFSSLEGVPSISGMCG